MIINAALSIKQVKHLIFNKIYMYILNNLKDYKFLLFNKVGNVYTKQKLNFIKNLIWIKMYKLNKLLKFLLRHIGKLAL